LFLASSKEYWTLGESLIQQYLMNDDSFLLKISSFYKIIMTYLKENLALANIRASSRGNTKRASVIHHN